MEPFPKSVLKSHESESLLSRVRDRTLLWVRSPFGLVALSLVSFFESLLLIPIATDPFLVAYVLAKRTGALAAVMVSTVASVLGGLVIYLLAMLFFDTIAAYYLTGTAAAEFENIASVFREHTFSWSFLGALTPIPYTLVALAAGFVAGNLGLFLIGSLVGRALRYAIVALGTYWFGDRVISYARQYTPFVVAVTIAIVALFIARHYGLL